MKKIKKRILLFHIILILALYFTVMWFFDYYNPYMNLLQSGLQGEVLLAFFILALTGSALIIKTGKGEN